MIQGCHGDDRDTEDSLYKPLDHLHHTALVLLSIRVYHQKLWIHSLFKEKGNLFLSHTTRRTCEGKKQTHTHTHTSMQPHQLSSQVCLLQGKHDPNRWSLLSSPNFNAHTFTFRGLLWSCAITKTKKVRCLEREPLCFCVRLAQREFPQWETSPMRSERQCFLTSKEAFEVHSQATECTNR